MFKPETLKKYTEKTAAIVKEYANAIKAGKPVNVSISKGNRKIGDVYNVSIAPGLTCGNCSHCIVICYDIKAGIQYKNVRNARGKNTALAIYNEQEYFKQIREFIARRRTHMFFRWHVGGEILSGSYFAEMVKTAEMFPNWTFWTYTKMYTYVNQFVRDGGTIPENFKIMFSEWDGMPLVNPYNFPVFSCKLKAGNINHNSEYFESLYKCPGNCNICKAAGRGCIAGESTYTIEH